ncbi:phage tail tube protein [Hydrocarboniphaga effusa]|uniref:phage tail tube protein n=1 Tax=Hydrocarboniphaga effusa TaxID=243629 RepID=UPI003BAB1982
MSQLTQGTDLFYQSAPDTMTRVDEITGVTGTGGARSQIDVTHLRSTAMEYKPGLEQPGSVSVPMNFDYSLAGHQALYALWESGARVKWVIGLSDGDDPPTSAGGVITFPTTRSYIEFTGFISDFPIDAALNSKLESTMTVQRSGRKIPHWKAPS